MRCNCAKEMATKIKEQMPELIDLYAPIEMFTGRMYINYSGTKLTNKGKKKDVEVPILLSKCPFCGMEQIDEEPIEE